MQRVELEVVPRKEGDKVVKKNLNQQRTEGWIPGVLYGNGDTVPVSINAKVFNKAIHTSAGTNALFNIKLGGQTALGVIKEIQRHILKHMPIHVDLKRVNMKEKLEMSIPIHVVGEAPGVKNSGGILEIITREIRIKCLPDDIPVRLDLDVSHLELGHSVKVKDMAPVKGVEYLTLSDTIVVNVVAPKIEEEKPVAGAEGVAAAEPEVIAKGKKDEEGEAGAAAGAPAAGAKPGASAAGAKAGAAAPAKGKEEKKK